MPVVLVDDLSENGVAQDMAEDVVIEDLVLKSTVQDLPIPNVDFAAFVRTRLRERPDATALIEAVTGQHYTYGEVESICESVAAGLQDLGMQPGDTVCFVSPNTADLMIAFIATSFAGATITCVKTIFNEREAERVLNMTKPTLVYCDAASAAMVKNACSDVPSVKVMVTTGDFDGMVNFYKLKETPRSKYKIPPPAGPQDTFTVFMSSGTTGLPKAALITHHNFIAALLTFGYKNPAMKKGNVCLIYLPVMHAAPFWVCFSMFTHHVKIVILAAMDLAAVLPPIEKYKVTTLILYPTHGVHIVQKGLPPALDLSSLRNIFIAGSSIPSQIMRGLAKLFSGCIIHHGYGLSEVSCACAYTRGMCHDFKTAGTPEPYVSIKVVDLDTRKKLGPGQCGELCIKGPVCFKGYLDNPEATAEIYDEEGYIKSGDTGYYSARGEVYVLDRIKDFVKCMDLQVAPAELEELLQDHADVAQAAVVGVPHSVCGEAPRAFIVLKGKARPRTPQEEEAKQLEFVKYIENLVAVHKRLHGGVEFVDVIPQTPTGKPNRRQLKEDFRQKAGAEAPKEK
ncbi:luciferin 4-monooxygenase-like [Haemaphysalis longicornis]